MKIRFEKSYHLFVILLWVMIICLFWFQQTEQCSVFESTLFSMAVFIPTAILTSYLSNRLLPKAIRGKMMKKFIIQFIIFSLIIALVHTEVFLLFQNLENTGFFEAPRLLNKSNHFIVEYIQSVPAVVIINLGFCGVRFYFEHTKLEEVHLKTQLRILQEQINPHFMFNVLNHIYLLMQKDVALASDLLVKYSEILRYQLYNGKMESVSVSQEIQFLKDVIDVEKVRWGNELTVNCTWQIEDGDAEIQPLLLITFVENAFKHVSRSLSEKGYINIHTKQDKRSLNMRVENSKSTQQVKKKNASGLGLKNIKERLEILYPSKHTLEIEETDLIYIIRLNITL